MKTPNWGFNPPKDVMSDLLNGLSGTGSSMQDVILQHIQLLLNTRKGSLVHLPDYGLPEYHAHLGQTGAKKAFIAALQTLIQRYEPRIQGLSVTNVSSEGADCIVQVTLTAVLGYPDKLCFDALLLKDGDILIRTRA